MHTNAVRDRMGRPLADLRVSLIDECNFRCTYCMPKELFGEGHPFLPPRALLSFKEIVTVVRTLAPLGVSKVKLTGGEPLMRPGMHELIPRLFEIPGIEDVGLITNGYHLSSLAPALRRAGLERVTISLDSLDPETFNAITGRGGGLPRVLKGIDAALAAGFAPVKVNMVVQRGVNSGEVVRMARRFRGTGVIVRFIEYMDVGRRNEFAPNLLVPNAEIRDKLDAEFAIEPVEENYYGEVADRYVYTDGAGEVGFISSMTQPFCGSCTRLRLSADGKLYRCLFSAIGLDAKAVLRADDAARRAGGSLEEAVRRFWGVRDDRYSELREEQGEADRDASVSPRRERIEMYRMGG
jgi:cyclic pyranopterin phosphate synthase